jgi:hypothetical protein
MKIHYLNDLPEKVSWKLKILIVVQIFVFLISSNSSFAQPATESVLYAVRDNGPGGIYQIDQITGNKTFVANTQWKSSGAAFDPCTRRIYYSEYSSGSSPYGLAYYDIASGSTVLCGNTGNVYFVKLGMSPSGVLYGTASSGSGDSEKLYIIDKNTGDLTLVGTICTNCSDNGDIAFSPLGVLYWVNGSKLYTLDPATAAPTFVADFSPSNGKVTGITFASNGDAYVTSYQASGSCTSGGDWTYRLDLQTGAMTCVGGAGIYLGDLTSSVTGIGAAQKVSSVSLVSPGIYKVEYDILIRNYGNLDLQNVQIVENVAAVYGLSFLSASAAAVGPLPPGITINSSYNGHTDVNVLTGGVNSVLRTCPNEEARIRITVLLSTPNMNTTYNINAVVTGTSVVGAASVNVRDFSRNDPLLDPDSDSDERPDGPGEDDATPLNFSTWSILEDADRGYFSVIRGQNDPVTVIKPNPFVDKVEFSFYSTSNQIINVRIQAPSGRVVRVEQRRVSKGNNFITLTNLSGLRSGYYILEVVAGSQRTTRKIVRR